MAVIISEFLPNPQGKDADGEFIELYNSGAAPADIAGWKIKDASNKIYNFPAGSKIEAQSYLSLLYSKTKISLNNNGEQLFLFDNQNKLIDQARYEGAAPAGEALIRQGNEFIFTPAPTPGKTNIHKIAGEKQQTAKSDFEIIAGQNNLAVASLSSGANHFNNFLIGIAASLILAALFVIIWRKLNVQKAS